MIKQTRSRVILGVLYPHPSRPDALDRAAGREAVWCRYEYLACGHRHNCGVSLAFARRRDRGECGPVRRTLEPWEEA